MHLLQFRGGVRGLYEGAAPSMNRFSPIHKILVFVLLLFTAAPLSGQLKVHVAGLESDEGSVLIFVFSEAKAYPKKLDRAIARYSTDISKGEAEFEITDLPDGEYALAIMHDENGNGELDMNFIGMPAEGLCASNNAKSFMGPPAYKDAKFTHTNGSLQVMRVKMKYLF